MQRGSLIFSAIFHAAIMAFVVLGLPQFFAHKPLEDTPIAVQLVTLADKTQATQITKTPPKPNAKPDVQVAQATPEPPKPEPPKPEPPKEAPPPPPPPPKPAETPPETKPEPKPTPPAPPPPAPPPPPEPPKDAPTPKPPKDVPKPEPPKPVTDAPKPKAKPEPPKQVAKNDSKETQKQETDFSSLLKNLTKQKTAPSPDDATPKSKTAPAQQQASSQPIAPLGSRLTVSEKDLVIQQIEDCWSVPAGAKDAQNLIIDIHIDVGPDRTVTNVQIVDQSRYNSDQFFRAAADSARRAVQNPRCSPLKLPADKYDEWKSITLSFNPKDVT
jgi:hypothetical protein